MNDATETMDPDGRAGDAETRRAPTRRAPSPAGDGEERNRELALKLWVVLSRAHEAVAEHVRADIERHGLTTGEFGVLEALYHKGPLHLGQVREKILVSSGGITYLMDRLEEKGLAERRPCPEDRRASYAALTDEGEALIRRIFPEHGAAIQRALSGLGPGRKQHAVRLLKELGHRARDLSLPGDDAPEEDGDGAGGRSEDDPADGNRIGADTPDGGRA